MFAFASAVQHLSNKLLRKRAIHRKSRYNKMNYMEFNKRILINWL